MTSFTDILVLSLTSVLGDSNPGKVTRTNSHGNPSRGHLESGLEAPVCDPNLWGLWGMLEPRGYIVTLRPAELQSKTLSRTKGEKSKENRRERRGERKEKRKERHFGGGQEEPQSEHKQN